MRFVTTMASGLLAVAFGSAAVAQDVFIYPRAGQSPQQLIKDRGECYAFAREQTGFDPLNPPNRDLLVAQAQQGQPLTVGTDASVVGGMARGALVGSAIGSWTDNSRRGTGAAGAAIGGIRAARRAERAAQQQQAQAQAQAEQQADAFLAQLRADYNRAFAVCMEARGYLVR